jgi:hypothetical protein
MRPRRGGGYPRDREGGPRGGGLGGGAGGSAGCCVLREGVTREADREGRRDDKALNHRIYPVEKTQHFSHNLAEPRMNDAAKNPSRAALVS